MTRLTLDTRPLRESPPFRRLWVGSSLSQLGSSMTTFAVTLQVYRLTHSSAAVGAVGLAAAAPAIAFGLYGGSLADAVDRRRLVLVMTAGQMLVSITFALQAFANLRAVTILYALVVVQSVLSAINTPARRTFMPRLLPTELVPAGAALTMLSMHASVTVGPSIAGVLAGAGGLRYCYLIDAVSFVGSFYGVAGLPAMPADGAAPRPGPRAVAEGLRFIRADRVVLGAFLADLNATVLGMPMALFPAVNAAHFGGRAETLGLLSTAPAIGGILGSTLSGPVGRVSRQGRAMLVAGTVWGAGVAGFGLARSLWLALLLLVLAGAADVLSVVFRTTIIQVATPDRIRGRVSAAEYVVGVGCPQLGNFRAGGIASLTSTTVSAVSGGLATIAGAGLIRLALPAFTRYRAHDRQSDPRPAAAP